MILGAETTNIARATYSLILENFKSYILKFKIVNVENVVFYQLANLQLEIHYI
jgi:hypothetical protein